jgi:single-stranded-DNA-specific exonuclease
MNKIDTVWKMKEFDNQVVKDLAYDLDIPGSVAQVLASRNIKTVSEAKKFYNLSISKIHDPYSLPDIKKVINRLNEAIDKNEKIFVWGDYDVDGITSTAIVVTALSKIGANFEYKVPHRMEDGYDIKVHSVDQAISAGASLLVSVDCGIVAFEAAEYAKKRGIDLIITDHHHPSHDGKIPDCIGVVNPNRDDPNYPGEHFNHCNPEFKRYPFDALAGCGIALKVMLALAHSRKLDVYDFLDDLVEFAALGTVADVAPMIDENRVIVSYGCKKLSASKKPGIKELLRIAGVKEVTTTSIGFQIGPRINAIGRLADSGTALSLLLADNDVIAANLANQLNNANIKRQEQQEVAIQQAIKHVEEQYDLERDHIVVIGMEEWHPGLIGLIAGKIAEMFNKPTLVCSIKDDGYAKGSCRSVRDFNILDALKSEEAWALFKKRADGSTVCGGHAFAAGFELATKNIPAMRAALNKYAEKIIGEPVKEKLIEVDARMVFSELNIKTYSELTKISPFGSMNNNPIFVTRNLFIHEIKSLSGGKHAKIKFNNGEKIWVSANAWRKGHWCEEFKVGDKVDVVYTLDIDTWGGNYNLTMLLEDMKPST